MYKITLLGKPKSTQNMYGDRVVRSGGRTMTMKYIKKDSKALKDNYIEQMRDQYDGEVMDCDISMIIEIRWFGAEVDFDNVHKLSMDAGNGIIWNDDKQITTATIKKMGKDNENPRIVIYFNKETRDVLR